MLVSTCALLSASCGLWEHEQEREISRSFNYENARQVELRISVKTSAGAAYRGTLVSVHAWQGGKIDGPPLARGVTDAQGELPFRVRVPGHLRELRVVSSALGIRNRATLPISDGTIRLALGGREGSGH